MMQENPLVTVIVPVYKVENIYLVASTQSFSKNIKI